MVELLKSPRMDDPVLETDKCKSMKEILNHYPHLKQAAEDAKKTPKPLPDNLVNAPIGFKPEPVTKA